MSGNLHLGLLARSRIKLVRQTELAECGLACLTMIANYHGLDVDLGTLRRRFEPSLRGASLKSLITTADRMGMTARALKLPLDELGGLHLPAILHWDLNHYVVLEEVKGGKALIHNPEGWSRRYDLDELSPHFTGVALELRPAENFEPIGERQRLRLPQLWRRITGLKRAIVQTLILSLVVQVFVLAAPYYMQIAIDTVLPALDRDLLAVLALGFGLLTLFNAGAMLLRSFVLLAGGTSLGYGVTTNIARRLFRLPIAWFEKRQVGDILSRFQSITPIQQFLTQGAVGVMLDGTLAILTLAVMFFYSPSLALIALIAFALYGVLRAMTFGPQRYAQEEAIVAAGKEQSVMIESLRGIITLRLFNREASRHALWQTRLADSMNASVSLARLGVWQTVGSTLIFGVENILSVWVAISLVLDGGFSVGMVFAFLAYKVQFLDRAASLVNQSVTFRMLGLHLERLSDIALADQDRSFTAEAMPSGLGMSGRVELRDVSFRYSPTDPLVLDRIDLVVAPGEHVAITGPSGGGKSTLVKVVLGLLEPSVGEVLIDGTPLPRFGYKNFHDHASAVLQDDHLFAGSLAENIALFDDEPDMGRIYAAAIQAAIHDDIKRMPMGYETLVGDMGSTLSGGQKQRVLLARALYRQPRVLVIDEGTSHLDAAHESAVNAAIAQTGVTRIIVAHRAETIAAASRVYVLTGNRLVARDDRAD